MLAIHTILHPTDFSPRAKSAFNLACALARDYDSRLVLLHVQPARMMGGRVVKQGDAATEILHLAKEISCELIVMGTHGRTGLARLLMGSTAETVSRKAHCPVMTVKHPFVEAQAEAHAGSV
jgi:nucleotide-binding universal stress UspA family protein